MSDMPKVTEAPKRIMYTHDFGPYSKTPPVTANYVRADIADEAIEALRKIYDLFYQYEQSAEQPGVQMMLDYESLRSAVLDSRRIVEQSK